MAETPRQSSKLSGWPAVCVLLVLHGALAFLSVSAKSLTYDEPIQLTGGYAALTRADYRISPASGLLPQLLCAVPAALDDGVRFEPERVQEIWTRLDKVPLCQHFLFESGNDVDAMVRRGRLMITLLSLALGLAVYLCARRMSGSAAGVLALGLYAVSPTVLAAGRLMTADTAGALFFLLATVAVWEVLHRVSFRTVALGALAVAGMFLAKMSAPTLVLICVVMLVVRLLAGVPLVLQVVGQKQITGRGGQLMVFAAVICVYAVVTAFCIWAAHGFRYSALGPATPAGATMEYPWEGLLERTGVVGSWIGLARDASLLPEAYLFGLADTFMHAGTRFAFLLGEHSDKGWWWFFPYAFLAKTPIGLLALFGLGLLRLRRGALYEKTPLLALIGVYALVALNTNLNIGHRHLLPMYPPLMILAAGAAVAMRRTWQRWFVGVAVALLVGESLLVHPHYLSFFNRAAGGPKAGHAQLADSSVDWGQDLPALRSWIDERRAAGDDRKLHLGYFGTHSPLALGFRRDQCIGPAWLRPVDPPFWLTGGYYAISATTLQSVYGQLRGRWSEHHERLWQQVRTAIAPYLRRDASRTWELLERERGRANALNVRAGYDTLRQLRLCAYLRSREPIAYAGYSILIFELSDDEVREALTAEMPLGS